MTWRTARSLDVLLAEINAAAPKRSKASDGSIGDDKHASRDSDHNPFVKVDGEGIVRARDFTHDPQGGLDCNVLAKRLAALIAARSHPALRHGAYVIWNGRIFSYDRRDEGWRPYTGSNPHDHHCHLSVALDPKGFDSTQPWGVMKAARVTPDLGVMLAACHGPSLTRDHIRLAQQIANREHLHSTGWSEAYKRIPFLKARPSWDCIVGTSTTDVRRGPKDNPILVSKLRTKIHESGAFKACRSAQPLRLAPERWITWVVYETDPDELLVLHVNIHPHPVVQTARRLSPRRLGHLRQMRRVERLVNRKRLEHGPDLHVVVTGDANSRSNWTAKYSPAQVFKRLGLSVYWHGILAVAHDPRLTRSVRVVPKAKNGQDHPWLVVTFKEKR